MDLAVQQQQSNTTSRGNIGGGGGGKGAARGKSLGRVDALHKSQNYRFKDDEQFAGAIKEGKHVLALDRKLQWKLAQIMEVRYEVPYDDDAQFWDLTFNVAEPDPSQIEAGGGAPIDVAMTGDDEANRPATHDTSERGDVQPVEEGVQAMNIEENKNEVNGQNGVHGGPSLTA